MSLRRKVLLVFVLVNAITLIGVVLYLRREGDRSRDLFQEVAQGAEWQAARAIQGLKNELDRVITDEMSSILSRRPSDPDLLLLIRQSPAFDQELVGDLVRKAVFVRLGDGAELGDPEMLEPNARIFNLRRRYIFEQGELDKSEAVRLVNRSLIENRLVEEAGRVAGPVMAGEKQWGGFYIDTSSLARVRSLAAYDTGNPLQSVLLIVVPGTLFLMAFIWFFLSRSVLEPIEDLSRVARGVSAGDYRRRLPVTDRRDEIGRLTAVVNRMLVLIEEYKEDMEARVQEKADEIERKNRELMLGQRLAATGALASGISHEINNPLGGMMNALNWLGREDLTEEQRERYTGILSDGIERIGGIVRRVLSFSPSKTTPVPIHLPDVVQRAVDFVMHRASRRDVEIVTRLDDDVPPVLGEPHEVGQIFLNLLINAIDASWDGGRVEVTLQPGKEELVVEVRDNGSGMTPEVAARAFDLFFTTKEAGQGTGLGLATVHALVEAHGGRIDLDSSPGEGTRFSVFLPAISGKGETPG